MVGMGVHVLMGVNVTVGVTVLVLVRSVVGAGVSVMVGRGVRDAVGVGVWVKVPVGVGETVSWYSSVTTTSESGLGVVTKSTAFCIRLITAGRTGRKTCASGWLEISHSVNCSSPN